MKIKITLYVSPDELTDIGNLLAKSRTASAVERVGLSSSRTSSSAASPLTVNERHTADVSPIRAMRAVRARLGCTLHEASDMVEEYRRSKP